MDAAMVLGELRERAGLSLRALADAADTSHSALAAYEAARKSPTARTMFRIIDAAGYAVDFRLAPRRRGTDLSLTRGEELRQVLELAEQFPARHASDMTCPVFPHQPI